MLPFSKTMFFTEMLTGRPFAISAALTMPVSDAAVSTATVSGEVKSALARKSKMSLKLNLSPFCVTCT